MRRPVPKYPRGPSEAPHASMSRSRRRTSSGCLFAIALAAFVSLGLPDGVLGVAWPSVRRTFMLPTSQLGVLLASSTIGYLASLPWS